MSAAATVLPVGERHGVAHTPSAAVRDAEHRDSVRYTVWYPAQAGAQETALTIGPPDAPLFEVGTAAANAPVAKGRWPVLLLSHGNGGTARMMGWFGTAMARAGYVVIAVDHPGNNGVDPMTEAGSILMWNRVDDLAAGLAAVQADPVLAPHADATRLGVAGYSAGGFTALVAAGARPALPRLLAFCRAHPADGVCVPQAENPTLTLARRMIVAETPALAPWTAKAGDDRAIAGVSAVFLIAPAMIQAFAPEDLEKLTQPVSMIVGTADTVAAPDSNSDSVAAALPQATLTRLPAVGHYDFLSRCTALGHARIGALCQGTSDQQATHDATIREANALFSAALPAMR
ncbi:alpha/beta hydrolase [Stenotrophomonas sp.]|uniref:alpha/beta hydrolase family protein n=1 Tax=Stenotrophomonas sp. TaxID=69392 RepID=UPI002FC94766